MCSSDLNMLEQADVESENELLRTSLITFVVVGGGFSGVETVGELNDFVRESIKHYYHNLEDKDAKVILVNSDRRIRAKTISVIKGGSAAETFDYKTKGMMALIGQRNGVGILLGHKVHGFTAWWLWRSYYLGNLPTVEKKLRVAVDWFIDLFFKRDVTRLKTFTAKRSIEDRAKQTEVIR